MTTPTTTIMVTSANNETLLKHPPALSTIHDDDDDDDTSWSVVTESDDDYKESSEDEEEEDGDANEGDVEDDSAKNEADAAYRRACMDAARSMREQHVGESVIRAVSIDLLSKVLPSTTPTIQPPDDEKRGVIVASSSTDDATGLMDQLDQAFPALHGTWDVSNTSRFAANDLMDKASSEFIRVNLYHGPKTLRITHRPVGGSVGRISKRIRGATPQQRLDAMVPILSSMFDMTVRKPPPTQPPTVVQTTSDAVAMVPPPTPPSDLIDRLVQTFPKLPRTTWTLFRPTRGSTGKTTITANLVTRDMSKTTRVRIVHRRSPDDDDDSIHLVWHDVVADDKGTVYRRPFHHRWQGVNAVVSLIHTLDCTFEMIDVTAAAHKEDLIQRLVHLLNCRFPIVPWTVQTTSSTAIVLISHLKLVTTRRFVPVHVILDLTNEYKTVVSYESGVRGRGIETLNATFDHAAENIIMTLSRLFDMTEVATALNLMELNARLDADEDQTKYAKSRQAFATLLTKVSFNAVQRFTHDGPFLSKFGTDLYAAGDWMTQLRELGIPFTVNTEGRVTVDNPTTWSLSLLPGGEEKGVVASASTGILDRCLVRHVSNRLSAIKNPSSSCEKKPATPPPTVRLDKAFVLVTPDLVRTLEHLGIRVVDEGTRWILGNAEWFAAAADAVV